MEKVWKRGWVKIAIGMFAIAFVLGIISMGFSIGGERRGILIWHENQTIGLWANGITLVTIGWTILCGLIEARRYEVRQRRLHN